MIKSPRLLTANHSGFPTDLPLGATGEALVRAQRAAVEAQVEAGLDIVTDGQVGYPNPLRPLIEGLGGLKLDEHTVNVPSWGRVRVPVVTGPIVWQRPIFDNTLKTTQETSGKPVKISMAGPYSLAQLALDPDGVYDSFGARITACAAALAREVAALAARGAAVIQVEEPVILTQLPDFPRLREALIPLAEARGNVPLALMLSGDSICPLYDWLQNLPVNVLGLDLVHSPRLISMIGDRETGLTLALGIVDPHTAALERSDTVFPAFEQMMTGMSAREVHIQPASTLATLNPDAAKAKLANLVTLVRDFSARPPAIV